MLKTGAAVVFATLCFVGAASAHGGGAAEPMPLTNYTDMPSYSPQRMPPARLLKSRHVRWQQGFARGCGHRKYLDLGVCGPTR
jgi:hypothetical protein